MEQLNFKPAPLFRLPTHIQSLSDWNPNKISVATVLQSPRSDEITTRRETNLFTFHGFSQAMCGTLTHATPTFECHVPPRTTFHSSPWVYSRFRRHGSQKASKNNLCQLRPCLIGHISHGLPLLLRSPLRLQICYGLRSYHNDVLTFALSKHLAIIVRPFG